MASEELRHARQAAIEMEVAVTRQVVELSAFGARPSLIAEVLGKRISLAEIKRIYKLTSRRDVSRGRPVDLRKIRKELSKAAKSTLARLLEDYVATTDRDFDHVDTVLATWRVHDQALAVHKKSTPIDLEMFMIAIRLMKAGQIDLVRCIRPSCEAPNVVSEPGATYCSTCNHRFDICDAPAVRGSERWSLNPAYAADSSELCESREKEPHRNRRRRDDVG